MTNQYELMLLTNAELDEPTRGGIITRAQEQVTTAGGSWVNLDDWGRRKLQYEILKQTEAHYSLLQFDCDGPALDEVVRILRITDGVMRVLPVTRPAPRPEGVPLELITAEEAEAEKPRGRGGRGGGGGGGRGRDRS